MGGIVVWNLAHLPALAAYADGRRAGQGQEKNFARRHIATPHDGGQSVIRRREAVGNHQSGSSRAVSQSASAQPLSVAKHRDAVQKAR